MVNTYNEMHPGHFHLNELAQKVRDGVLAAGGVPFVFGTIAICDGFAQANRGMCYALPSREVIADSIEVMVEGHRYDGLVLVGGCDKIVPAMLMAALRLNIPGGGLRGPMFPAARRPRACHYQLKEMDGKAQRGLTAGRAGGMEDCFFPSAVPALMASLLPVHRRRGPGPALPLRHRPRGGVHERRLAKASGERVVEMSRPASPPARSSTGPAENAFMLAMAVGGSTTAAALPGHRTRDGLELALTEFERLSRATYRVKIKPAGVHTLKDRTSRGGAAWGKEWAGS